MNMSRRAESSAVVVGTGTDADVVAAVSLHNAPSLRIWHHDRGNVPFLIGLMEASRI